MPRVEFEGIGDSIPTIALPPFGGDNNLPPTVLTFTDNADFPIAQYRDLGFTHYEAWCVGAAGGRGGDSSAVVQPVVEEVMRPVPQDVWNLELEYALLSDYQRQANDHFNGYAPPPQYGRVYDPSVYGYYLFQMPAGWVGTAADAAEYKNPSHLKKFRTYRTFILMPQLEAMGGGGGGGGMHKVSGLLETLPAVVPIVVGKAGADAGYGQTKVPGVWVPAMTDDFHHILISNPAGAPWPSSRMYEIINFFTNYLDSYPPPNAAYPNPQAGADGGYSTFGDVGMASGGKGGFPGKVWDGSKFIVSGKGGDGGVGGRIVAGGGGAGSTLEGVNGSDGIWRPELGIGAGGGGGKGGLPSTFTDTGYIGGGYGTRIEYTHLATAGGQGSYSFADTTVYGQRQSRQPWEYIKPVVNLLTGAVTYVPTSDPTLVIPGGGGGARPTKNLKVGSRATGYSPNGAVVVRLTRIT